MLPPQVLPFVVPAGFNSGFPCFQALHTPRLSNCPVVQSRQRCGLVHLGSLLWGTRVPAILQCQMPDNGGGSIEVPSRGGHDGDKNTTFSFGHRMTECMPYCLIRVHLHTFSLFGAAPERDKANTNNSNSMFHVLLSGMLHMLRTEAQKGGTVAMPSWTFGWGS